MKRASGDPHTAAGVSAHEEFAADEGITVHHSIEALVDAELEKLATVAPMPELPAEPEVMGGCSCGAVFFTYEAADEHPDRCRFNIGPFGEAVRA